jgi:hypothetical protein
MSLRGTNALWAGLRPGRFRYTITVNGDIVNKLFWLSGQCLFVTAMSAQMIYGPTDDPKEYVKSLMREEMWVVQHPTYGFAHNPNERSEDLLVNRLPSEYGFPKSCQAPK